jgi:putative ABC transport system substrate-binding protein
MSRITRRELVALAGAAAAWPVAARGQGPGTIKRIAILADASEADEGAGVAMFRQALERTGWSEGSNLQNSIRWGEGRAERIRALAEELVKMNPDLILALGGTGLTALLGETRSIPIVFAWPGDPVASGLVASMARPGGNATGFTAYEGIIGSQWLELLREIAPSVGRVLVLSPGNPNSKMLLPEIEKAGRAVSVQLTSVTVADRNDIDHAIEAAVRESKLGMIVLPGSLTLFHRARIIELAAQHRLPAVYGARIFADGGGLISYGPVQFELYRQSASYVDRILRGERPSDLPVQGATKFELVVNIKAAKALGLSVPNTLLVSADEVIE